MEGSDPRRIALRSLGLAAALLAVVFLRLSTPTETAKEPARDLVIPIANYAE